MQVEDCVAGVREMREGNRTCPPQARTYSHSYPMVFKKVKINGIYLIEGLNLMELKREVHI